MTAVMLAKTLDLPRVEWLQLRRQGIGGSDAAAILGLNPWKTPMDVWLEKTGEFTRNDEQNEKMYWGNVLEDVVAREFMARTGLKVRRRNAILKHKDLPFMIANIDRLVTGQRAGLECKTAGQYTADDWAMGVPEYYQAQVQHYMAVTGYPVWFVAVLIGGQEFKYYKITRDNYFIRQLIEAETEFWNMVETRTPPPVDGTKASTELIKRLYPEAEKGKEVELPFEAFELIQQYERACEEEKRIKLIKDEAVNKLKDMLGTAERGSIHGRRVIWQNVVSKRLDTKALQKEYPDIYERFAQGITYRRFSIK
ncbi:MAG: YqaJ viral recombinase family protein [Desulfotomaculaceae bacterium]|nr:YqaJ viral recombinase family protein [Desulfotomaculaceae bacterium]